MSSIITQHQDFFIVKEQKPSLYNFGMVQVIKTRENTIQNRVEAKVKKTYLRTEDIGLLYRVEINDRTQTNIEGQLGVEKALSFLVRKLVLLINFKGEIIGVINGEQIKENWHRQMNNFKSNFKDSIPDLQEFLIAIDALIDDKQALLNLVNKSEVLTLLFPPVYEQKLFAKKIMDQQKDLYDFFENYALTLKLNTLLKNTYDEGGMTQIVRSGTLDKRRFKMDEVKKDLRAIYQIPNLSVKIKADYLEAIDLDYKNSVDASTQMLNVEIKHIYNLRQFSKLKKI